MADTPNGETVTPGDSQTNGTPSATTPVVNADTAEVERLRKEAEQARMRANQAQNELDKIKADQEAARQKQLEEQNEYKELYEKTNADLQTLRDTQAASERQAELSKVSDGILNEYPKEVVELAQTTGISLADESEAAQSALKAKLDAIKEKVAPGSTAPVVTSSNPNPSAPAESGQTGTLARPKQLGVDNGQVAITDTNPRLIGDYISKLPAIERMKRDAGLTQ